MLACMTGLVACGKEETADQLPTGSELQIAAEIEDFVGRLASGLIDASNPYFSNVVANWNSSLPDIGTYQGIVSSDVKMDGDQIIVDVTVAGSEHNAVVEYVGDIDGTFSITINVSYSMGELMQKAALNTLMGMGTVFAVLILISLIISCFNLIPKIQAAFGKKPAAQTSAPAAAPKAAPAAASAPAQENLTDDLELVAVIAAAIAASEGAVSTDGFVVRSIRKVNKSKWQNA